MLGITKHKLQIPVMPKLNSLLFLTYRLKKIKKQFKYNYCKIVTRWFLPVFIINKINGNI